VAEHSSLDGRERQAWNVHWRVLTRESAFFGALTSLVRKVLLSRAVAHYTERFFSRRGLFVETGCGTSEASSRIGREGRRLIGLDFSLAALDLARRQRRFDLLVCADIRALPFRDDALTGLWNLGVMEHFPAPEARQILREHHRVLDPAEGTLLLFWPPTFGLSRWVLAPVEALRSLLSGRRFRFFPDEVNRLTSRRSARATLEEVGFEPLRLDFSARDGVIHLVMVARRASR